MQGKNLFSGYYWIYCCTQLRHSGDKIIPGAGILWFSVTFVSKLDKHILLLSPIFTYFRHAQHAYTYVHKHLHSNQWKQK